MSRVQPAHLAALAILAFSCGRPEVSEVRHAQVVLDEVTPTTIVSHRANCPSERHTMKLPAPIPCLGKLAAGSTIETVDYSYHRPMVACGDADLPKDTFGGCVIGGVAGIQYLSSGPPCP